MLTIVIFLQQSYIFLEGGGLGSPEGHPRHLVPRRERPSGVTTAGAGVSTLPVMVELR